MEGLFVLVVVAAIVVYVLRSIVHIVPEYQRLIVFSLGKYQRTSQPGLVLLAPPPFQSVAATIDLREFVVEIPQQTCITQDNAPIAVDFLIYQRVIPEQAKDQF